MADQKISELSAAVAVADTDEFVIARAGANLKVPGSLLATQAELDAHTADAADAHDASAISVVPAGTIAATDVQAALEELDSEKAAASAAVLDGDAAGGVLSGTYPNPGFAVDMATQAELDVVSGGLAAHLADAADAHDASAISVLDAAGDFTADNVEDALAELQADAEADAQALADHLADATAAHAASAVSVNSATLSGVATDVQGSLEELDNLLDDHSARHENGGADEISLAGLSGTPEALQTHLDDATAAHAASAISYAGSAGLSATDVEAALDELDSEKMTAAQVATEIADQRRVVTILVTDPNGDALTTGDGKAFYRIPSVLNGHNLVAVAAAVTTVSSSGTPTIQVHNLTQAADMLSTRITIDANEKDSKDATDAAVIDTANDDVATGDQIRIDVDVAGTGTKGLIVELQFEAP